jgi:hypothetical protein
MKVTKETTRTYELVREQWRELCGAISGLSKLESELQHAIKEGRGQVIYTRAHLTAALLKV